MAQVCCLAAESMTGASQTPIVERVTNWVVACVEKLQIRVTSLTPDLWGDRQSMHTKY